jgi:hypothetical protein
MHRNSLQGLANTLAEMAIATGAAPLYDRAASFPDGQLRIDLLTRTASLDGRDLGCRPVVDRLANWLTERAARTRQTTWAAVLQAEILVQVETGPIPTVRDSIVQLLVRPSVTLRTARSTATVEGHRTAVWIHRERPEAHKEAGMTV